MPRFEPGERTRVALASVLGGDRRTLNLIAGANASIEVADDPANEEVDVTIGVSGTGSLPLSGSAGTGKGWVYDAGLGAMVWTDLATQAELGDHAALVGQGAHSEVTEAKRGGQEFVETNATATGAVTLALANANVFILTLTGAVVFTFTGATNGRACSFTVVLIQGSGGSKTVTWPGSVVWPSAVAPTLTTTAAQADVFSFMSVDGGTKWFGFPAGANFA
jgi:hypothetical protein